MRKIKKLNVFRQNNILIRLDIMKNNLLAGMENSKNAKIIGLGMMAFGCLMLAASQACAFTPPASGSFAYTVYDVAVTQILGGAIGFVAGVGAMVFGAILAIQQKVMGAIPAILGGAVLLNAETLVTTLGLTF